MVFSAGAGALEPAPEPDAAPEPEPESPPLPQPVRARLAVSASAVKADEKINEDYAEAVAVLNGMGVFKGYEDGSFKPENNITRAEVATIIYRIYTGDVAKNDKSGLYASYNKFTDMAGAGWAAGYIG